MAGRATWRGPRIRYNPLIHRDVPFDLKAVAAGLLEAAPDAIIVTGEDGTIALVNGQAERIFGYSRGEMIGQSVELLVPEADRRAHAEHRTKYARQPRVRPMGPSARVTGRRKDGSEFPSDVSLSPIVVEGRHMVIAILRDVTERHAAEERARFLATHDGLTELYNRAYFDEEMNRLTRGRRFPVAVLVIDLDDLKLVNDTQGHAAGDRLLVRAARLFRTAVRGEDVIARLGGDEFAVLLPETDREGCAAAIARLREAAAQLRQVEPDAPVEFSVGGAVAEHGTELPDALREADQAMYQDKRTRRASRSSPTAA